MEHLTTAPDGKGLASDLDAAVAVVLERLAVTASDAFLVVGNSDVAHMSELVGAVADAARQRTDRVEVCEYMSATRDGEEPPGTVAVAMSSATAVVLLTRYSLSHTEARMNATRKGARIASMPGITADAFVRALPADYEHLQRSGETLAARLTAARSCHVTAPAGTDIHLSLADRTAIGDDGDLRAPGAFGNLPAGEAYIAPLENQASGAIVFDGSVGGWGLLEEPLEVIIERGRITGATGGVAAEWLLETLDAGGPEGRVAAELGIGTNPCAQISGLVVEDEKAIETVHFAFGSNTTMGGTNHAAVHIDALVLRPRVELDDVLILDDGRPVG